MKHLGDISKINGAEIEPVDIVCFGSPCQSLSVAGKREGLKHTKLGDDETTRSGLFMEAVRIIKEMREASDGKYPRFALWENVPGAFSSNKGEDFRVVLEELIKIAEPSATMPEVPPFGWAYADSYVGDGWSLAYRVFDTQHWPRTPQRRRRIYLVADFGGQGAREILFEREGLRGHLTESPAPRERVTAYVEVGSGTADSEGADLNTVSILNSWDSQGNHVADGTGSHNFPTLRGCGGAGYQAGYVLAESKTVGVDVYNQAITGKKSKTLSSSACDSDHVPCVLTKTYAVATQQGGAEISEDGICPTVTAAAGMSGNNQPWICAPKPYGISSYDSNAMKSANPHSGIYEAETSRTLDLNGGNPACNQGGIAVVEPVAQLASGGDVSGCLMASGYDKLGAQEMFSGDYTVIETHPSEAITVHGEEISGTLLSRDYKGAGRWDSLDKVVCCPNGEDPIALDRAFYNQGQNAQYSPQYYTDGTVPTLVAKGPAAVCAKYIVRRLTPTECARLQGFPDTWGHPDKKDSLSDEEYEFWLEVRNTHAAINGKAVKEYSKDQMLKWYNKLHSDSAEYKMWGNGIALPPTLYCMQGIEEALKKDINEEEK